MKTERNELVKRLNEGMAHLSQNEKYVLLLKYYEDLNDSEICEVLSITKKEYANLITMAKMKMNPYTFIFDEIDKMNREG